MPEKKRSSKAKSDCIHYLVRDIPVEHQESWKEAAAAAGLSLRAWIVTRLTQSAREELG